MYNAMTEGRMTGSQGTAGGGQATADLTVLMEGVTSEGKIDSLGRQWSQRENTTTVREERRGPAIATTMVGRTQQKGADCVLLPQEQNAFGPTSGEQGTQPDCRSHSNRLATGRSYLPTPPKGKELTVKCMMTSLPVTPPLEVSSITRLISWGTDQRHPGQS